jgi:AraC-like DNA-binding protein
MSASPAFDSREAVPRARAWRVGCHPLPEMICIQRVTSEIAPRVHERASLMFIRSRATVRLESHRNVATDHESILFVPPRLLHGVNRFLPAPNGSLTLLLGAPVRIARSTRATPLIPVRDYLRAHVEESVSIESLVRLSGLTEFHLIRAFHREFGLPPHAYHVRLKLARAREMLSSGATVTRTAFACGFAGQSHLSRKFKEVYGLTPATWMTAVAPSSPAIPFTTKARLRAQPGRS